MSYTNASILVVDDEESNRDILARRLSKEGYTVAVAEGGKAALDMLRLEVYDVVLLDIMMPEIDGYEVLKYIKVESALHHIPVIMMTALNDEISIKRCLQLGAADYVGKPFELAFLKSRIWHAVHVLGKLSRPTAVAEISFATVLVVEDDEENRDLLVRRLNKAGHAVHIAASGAEALLLLNKHRYDLVLLDIMMAQMDGYQTLQKIRALYSPDDLPVIMVSALGDSAGIERCMELGADDYIVKPYNAVILKERVLNLLAKRKQSGASNDD